MKLTTIVRPAVAALTLIFTGMNAYAADNVNINITGKVIASPCTTINGSTADLSVPLGDTIQASSLASANSGTAMVPFELKLTGCPASTTNVHATFSGTADTDATLWKNTAGSAATNTAVEVSDQTGGALVSNGDARDAAVASGEASFKLQARAVSKIGSATPGDISATIVAALEYQ